jgi:hypothetical protein
MSASTSGYIREEDDKHVVVFTFHDYFDGPIVKKMRCKFDNLQDAEMFKEVVLENVKLLKNSSDYRMATGLSLAAAVKHTMSSQGYELY